jgi:hypothetical protein
MCAGVLSDVTGRDLRSAVALVEERDPGGRWIFLTLTQRDRPAADLRVTWDQLQAGWSRFRKRLARLGFGGYRHVEISKTDEGTELVHLHQHFLLRAPASYFREVYLEHEEWVAMWRECLGVDYDPGAYVRAVHEGGGGDRSLGGAVAELVKYVTKSSDLVTADDTWLYHVLRAAKGRQKRGAFGIVREALREVRGTDEDASPDDILKGEDEREAVDLVTLRFRADVQAWDVIRERAPQLVERFDVDVGAWALVPDVWPADLWAERWGAAWADLAVEWLEVFARDPERWTDRRGRVDVDRWLARRLSGRDPPARDPPNCRTVRA